MKKYVINNNEVNLPDIFYRVELEMDSKGQRFVWVIYNGYEFYIDALFNVRMCGRKYYSEAFMKDKEDELINILRNNI